MTQAIEDRPVEEAPPVFEQRRRIAPRGSQALLVVSLLAALGMLAFFSYMGSRNFSPRTDPLPKAGLSTLPALQLQTDGALQSTEPVSPQEDAGTTLWDSPLWEVPRLEVPQIELAPIDLVRQRRLHSRLSGDSQTAATTPAEAPPPVVASTPAHGPLSTLQPLRLAPAAAGQLPDRHFLLTQGSTIDCVLQTRLVSTYAGLVTCQATRDVRSHNGKVVLIDAGSQFVGYQQGGLSQGQARVFVVWARLITPDGITIELDSPGTGPLGEAGLDGAVDYHFGQRFGNAILVSLIGDVGNWLSNQGRRDSGIRFDTTTEGAKSAVTTVLENSIAIPPTLYKNQGERIGILVARDLDFSTVYDLKPAAR